MQPDDFLSTSDLKPLLFVHLPKTAGSSLNQSASDCFGSDRTERDYGSEREYSTKLVRHYIHNSDTIDQYGFHTAFLAEGKKWLAGHFDAERYIHLFGAEQAISFVRDPVERVISEYFYLVRKHGLERSFEEFYKAPEETNKQFRMIGQIPWQAFHLVGTQEKYSECIRLLAKNLSLPLEENRTNVSPSDEENSIDDATRADIAHWNARDILFVEEVRAYLEKQFEAEKNRQPFCYHDVGFEAGKHAIGWAFYGENNDAVTIGLSVDGVLKKSVKASEHRPVLQRLLTPRKGHNGFRFVLNDYACAQSLEIQALETNQCLFKWSRS